MLIISIKLFSFSIKSYEESIIKRTELRVTLHDFGW